MAPVVKVVQAFLELAELVVEGRLLPLEAVQYTRQVLLLLLHPHGPGKLIWLLRSQVNVRVPLPMLLLLLRGMMCRYQGVLGRVTTLLGWPSWGLLRGEPGTPWLRHGLILPSDVRIGLRREHIYTSPVRHLKGLLLRTGLRRDSPLCVESN